MPESSPQVPPRFIVESLVDPDGTVSLRRAYEVANSLGVADQTLRLAIRRTIDEGRFTQSGRGRAGTLHRTPAAGITERHDIEFIRHAYAMDAGEAPWDGRWRLVAVSIAERDRSVRDQARRTLVRLGAGQVRGGVYVSPHDVKPLLLAECPALKGVEGVMFALAETLEVGAVTDPRTIASTLWNLTGIVQAHEALRAACAAMPAPAALTEEATVTASALRIAWAFGLAHRHDPLLPGELLPQPWAGTIARAAFANAWSELQAFASSKDLPLFQRYAHAHPYAINPPA